METVLVTGVAGFIASRTATFLLEAGKKVVGIDNMNTYYDVRLKEYRLAELKKYPNFEFHLIDLENKTDLEKVCEKHQFSAILNLAARAGVRYSMENPYVYLSTNTEGTLNLLEMMRKSGTKKMVLASTSSLYAGMPMPFTEDLAVNTPLSPYAATKKAAEMLCYSYHALYGLDISVVRYFTVYGIAGRPDMSMFRFIKWIAEGTPVTLFGDGEQTRDFTYIDDIARGTIAATKELGYQVINLGGGKKPVSLNYIISLIEQHLGKKAIIEYKPFHKADILETQANIAKAERVLGWKPQTDVEEGLRKTVEWYLAHQHWLKNISCEEGN